MFTAPGAYLPRYPSGQRLNARAKPPAVFATRPKLHQFNTYSLPVDSIRLRNNHFVYRVSFIAKASEAEDAEASKSGNEAEREERYEEYEVELQQPYGLRFTKGRDGGTYIDVIAPGGAAAKCGKFTVGDKVVATSAVFGTDIWPAAEYGRTMYTIRQRIGPLLMRMQKRYGKIEEEGELSEKEIIRAERNSGVISGRVREIQMLNAMRKRELKERREKELREGLQLYRAAKYEEAREKFESVLGSKPDSFEASAASYNVACCYSKLNQAQAGLSALEEALKAGYEDFKRIRSDPDLANVRASNEFELLMKSLWTSSSSHHLLRQLLQHVLLPDCLTSCFMIGDPLINFHKQQINGELYFFGLSTSVDDHLGPNWFQISALCTHNFW